MVKGRGDSETVYSSTEGLFEYAFDGNSGTIWHSNWQGASDKLKPQGTFDAIGGVIDLGQKYTINQFKFTPRSGTNSGQVTKADLYVKANEGDDWIKVAEDAEFADDATTKTFYFDEQEVQYVWFVAKESDDGWVAVSEFDIANAPAQSYTVYVDAQKGGTVTGGKSGVAAGTEVTVTAEAENGYTFAGWYDSVTGAKVSDDAEYTFAVTENTALTAHFTGEDPEPDETYTVTVDDKEYTVEKGGILQIEEPQKPGCSFDGFYVVGTDEKVDFTQPITSDMNVESRFTEYKVTVAEIEGVTFTVSEMNEAGEVTVTAPERTDYLFKGWKEAGNDTIISYANPYTFIPERDTTLEAIYEKTVPEVIYHTVTINGQKVQVEDGKTIAQPADPVKEGYKFIGWYVGDEKYDFSKPVTSDLTIEARFEKIDTSEDPGNQKPGGSDPDKNDGNNSGTSGGKDKDGSKDKAVQTGDTANPAVWAVCLLISAGAAAVVLRKRRKK